MLITNKKNLPEPFVKACQKSVYRSQPNRYGVTTLLKGNMEIILTRRYFDLIEQDASEMVWAIFGTAVHKVLEESGNEKESEIYVELPITSKSKVCGFIDYVDITDENKPTTDWKSTSVFKYKSKDYEDFEKQLLAYNWLISKIYGVLKRKAQDILIFKDYSESERLRDPLNYPDSAVYSLELDFKDEDFTYIAKYISDKIYSLEADIDKPDEEITVCSPKQRWAKKDSYKVFRNDNKTPTKVLFSQLEAENFIASQKKPSEYRIEFKKGEDNKCQKYCKVNEFCPYYKKIMESQNE